MLPQRLADSLERESQTMKQQDRKRKNVDAAAWLAVFLDARQRGDFVTAARAQRELALIGVKLTVGDAPQEGG
jgi:hypothetical protein